jgi:nucleotide-binding universal stress UspA family protein
MYEKILVPLDGSELAEKVLPHVQALAEKFGSEVILLRATLSPEELVPPTGMGMPMGDMTAYGTMVTPGTVENFEELMEVEETETKTYLDTVVDRLKASGLNATAEHVEGHAGDVIVDRAASLGAGLIIMATHGRSGLARAFVGNVADEVVRRSSCPVLLVRISDKELKKEPKH